MNWKRSWGNAVLVAAFVGALAAPVALYGMITPLPPKPVVRAARTTLGDTFAPTCTADQAVDTRPDPAWVWASFDGDNCWAPKLPAAFEGENASRDQFVAAMVALKNYKAKVGAYQRCVANAVAFRKAEAVRVSKPVDAAFVTIESHRFEAGEKNKTIAGERLATEIEAFSLFVSVHP